jgi:hypothetical protein
MLPIFGTAVKIKRNTAASQLYRRGFSGDKPSADIVIDSFCRQI